MKATTMRRKAETVVLKVDLEKLIYAISFLISLASEKGRELTQYDIVKSLFLADRAHLNRFGRLITSDNYYAMKHGPVPSVGYDILKEDKGTLQANEITSLPWKRRKGDRGKFHFSQSDPLDYDSVLSESDMSELKGALGTVTLLSFGQIRKLTHEDQAYIDAWEDDAPIQSFPMSLALLFETPDYEKAHEVRDLSELR